MQYFSFIGTGGQNGYDEINYYFDNDPSLNQIKSQFIQEAIIKKTCRHRTHIYFRYRNRKRKIWEFPSGKIKSI